MADTDLVMARTLRQQQAFVSALRESAMQLCAGVGVLGGVWWGLKHPEHVRSCSTHGPTNTVLARCTSHTLTAVTVHWALILGVAFGIGALIGVVVASLIPRPKRA
jgi:hypothetical protein